MHTLYFTRHGETVWNVENKICGMTDSPLTERGRQQARKLGEAVKASGVHIDEILYSPLSRAADTAMAIAEATGLPARCEPRLREQCFGKYEGTPRNGGEFRVSKTHFADRYDGGESMMQLAQRIYNLLDELKADTGKTYLLVAHNGIARKLGEAVKASGVHIDEILYSPLSRAADTAMAIAEATGLPARCEPRLREQCFGKYEGTPRNGGEFRVSKTHFADRYDGGESMMQLAQRIYNLLDELKADTGKTYLLVAHNGIARVVQSYFYDMTNEEYAAAGIKNCELVEYHFE